VVSLWFILFYKINHDTIYTLLSHTNQNEQITSLTHKQQYSKTPANSSTSSTKMSDNGVTLTPKHTTFELLKIKLVVYRRF
jgi:hypothetical protein